MPITVGYDVPFELQGRLGYEAGRGRFLQTEDKFNEEIRQYDEQQGLRQQQFSESQRQYDVGAQYKYDALGQNNQQFQQQLHQHRLEMEHQRQSNDRKDSGKEVKSCKKS